MYLRVGRGQLMMPSLEREDGLKVPTGKFFLVDAGYAVRPGFLPPYHGTRYHLKEYGRRNHPQNAKELFNLRHSSLRTMVERAFAAYKNHWKFVYNKPFHGYKTQVKVVLACTILHNWVLQYGEDEYFPLRKHGIRNPMMKIPMILSMTIILGLRSEMNLQIICGRIEGQQTFNVSCVLVL